jgi:hypothetical protein
MNTDIARERSWWQCILPEAARTFLILFLVTGYFYFWNGNLEVTKINTSDTTRIFLDSSNFPTIYTLQGKSPPAMPSVLLKGATATDSLRGIYGGKNDGLHLGGFTDFDEMGVSKNLWNFMMGPLGVKSFLDVGCSV